MSLRDRKRRRTRQALSDAAVSLFLERGFDAVTIDEIAQDAGVSRRTFFRYFPTKDAAFFAAHEERLEVLRAALEPARTPAEAWQHGRDALLGLAVDYMAEPEAFIRWREAMRASDALQARDLALDACFEDVLRQAFARTGFQPFDASITAGAMMGVVRATLGAWAEGEGRQDLVVLGRRAFERLERGLGASLQS